MVSNDKNVRQSALVAMLAVVLYLPGPYAVSAENVDLFELSEKAKKLIVHIAAADGAEGSGIVVNVDDKYVYGVTAKHVVTSRNKIRGDLKVKLRMWNRALPMEVDRAHYELDLAAFRVDYSSLGLSAGEVLDSLDFAQLGKSTTLNPGDGVMTIGHAASGAWIDSKVPGHLASDDGDPDTLAIQYICPPGHSGGGAFDQNWRLVGMIVDFEDPFCHALRIETVLRILSDWKYEHRLELALVEDAPGAPETITVAVVDFDNRSGANIPDIGPAGRDITTSFLFNLPGVKLVTRDRLASVNREIYLAGTQGSSSGASRLGKILDADAIVTGSVNRYDVERRTFKGYNTSAATDTYRMSLTLQVIDVNTAEVKFSETFNIERKTSYAQATSAPYEPLSRESELLKAILENYAKEKVQSAMRQIAAGMGTAGRLVAVQISTVPEGAEVIINGILEGTAPLTVNLAMGMHEIEVFKRGYVPWKRRVRVVPDLRPLDIHLSPEASPSQ